MEQYFENDQHKKAPDNLTAQLFGTGYYFTFWNCENSFSKFNGFQ